MSDEQASRLTPLSLWRLLMLQQLVFFGVRVALVGLGLAMRTWAWLARVFLGTVLMVY